MLGVVAVAVAVCSISLLVCVNINLLVLQHFSVVVVVHEAVLAVTISTIHGEYQASFLLVFIEMWITLGFGRKKTSGIRRKQNFLLFAPALNRIIIISFGKPL